MRFQLTANARNGNDMETLAVIFTAPTWADAQDWANRFLSQIGDRNQFETLITYASETEGFFRNTVAERPLVDPFENGPLPHFNPNPHSC